MEQLFVFLVVLPLAACSNSDAPSVEALEAQLAGNHCRFDYPFGTSCQPRKEGFWQWLLREPHQCDMAAVQCLAEIGSPAAHDALIGVLTTKTDVETCDGTWYVRTEAVNALGKSGYKPAIPALEKHLASNPTGKLSSGASGCVARTEPTDQIVEALDLLSK